MTKVFLSGGSGFLGKNILEQKPKEWSLEAPPRSVLDLNNSESVKSYFDAKCFDLHIHGANVGGTRKPGQQHGFFESNMEAFHNAYAQRASSNAFFFLSSGAAYARPLETRKVTEDELGTREPLDEYGLAKLMCSKELEKHRDTKSVALHIFGVYGPYEDYAIRFISNAILRTLFHLPISINRDVEFDYLHVFDFVRILEALSSKHLNFVHLNIGSGESFLLSEIAEIIRHVLGSKNDIKIKEPALGAPYVPDVSRLKQSLGEQFRFTTLAEGISHLATWYESRMHTLEKTHIFKPI